MGNNHCAPLCRRPKLDAFARHFGAMSPRSERGQLSTAGAGSRRIGAASHHSVGLSSRSAHPGIWLRGSRSTGGRNCARAGPLGGPLRVREVRPEPSAACSRCLLSCRNSIVTARSRSIMMAVVGDDLVRTSAAWLPTRLRPRAGGQVPSWGLRLQHRHLRSRGRTAHAFLAAA
jgi:hypothetical protein